MVPRVGDRGEGKCKWRLEHNGVRTMMMIMMGLLMVRLEKRVPKVRGIANRGVEICYRESGEIKMKNAMN